MNDRQFYTESFRTSYQKFINACDSFEDIDKWDKKEYGEMDAYYANDIVSVLIHLIAADGVISDNEVTLLNELFGFDYTIDGLEEVYQGYSGNIERILDEDVPNGYSRLSTINKELALLYKEMIVSACRSIAASDMNIDKSEISVINRIISM